MNATPGMLIGVMILLLVLALSLVILLIRGMRKGKAKKSSTAKPKAKTARKAAEPPSSEAQRVESVSAGVAAGLMPEAIVPEAVADPSQPVPSAVQETTQQDPDTRLLMRVWQDREGRLVVEAEGQSYQSLFEVQDGEVGRRVLETINRLGEFAQGQDSRVPTVPTPAAGATISSAPVVDTQSDVLIEKLRSEEVTSPPKSRITADPLPFRIQDPGQQANITLNLAREVDELLQIRLKAAPEYAQRYIHVVSARDGTLRFDVDGVHYGSLQEVPDLQTRQVIQAAIVDWETRR